jgi:hypothetical protein
LLCAELVFRNTCTLRLARNIVHATAQERSFLRACSRTFPAPENIFLYGHSLGAALAQVFATLYAFLPPDKQPLPLRSKIYTFAGPMALWIDNVIDNSNLLDSKFHCVNFVNNNDVVPRLFCRSTPAIISYLLKNLTVKNAFLTGLVSLITPSIEDKVEEFKIVVGFSPLAVHSELLVPNSEPKVVTHTRETSQQPPYDIIIGKSIKGLNVDDHNTARYVNNLSLCGKFNEVTKKWVSRDHTIIFPIPWWWW